MNDRNVDQLLDAWLDLGPDVAPDRVHSAVALEVRTTRQAFGWSRWASERFPSMNNPIRVAVALAAAAVIAFVGLRYLVPDNTGDPDPTATPSATASPTATPVGVPLLPPFGTPLDPGTYTIDAVPGSIVSGSGVAATLSIGDGWESGGWYVMNPPDFTKQVSFWTIENVHEDICDPESLPDPVIGPTVRDLVAALDAQANTDMSRAVDIEVGGFTGKRVIVRPVLTADCLADGDWKYFSTPHGAPGRGFGNEWHGPDTLWIIDVDGHRVVVITSTSTPDDTEASESIARVMRSLEFEVN
jgi:hypothetical protein